MAKTMWPSHCQVTTKLIGVATVILQLKPILAFNLVLKCIEYYTFTNSLIAHKTQFF